MNIYKKLQEALLDIISQIGVGGLNMVHLEHPNDMMYGDFSTNIAMVLSKQLKKNPIDIANDIVSRLKDKNIDEIKSIEVVNPGFINIYLSDSFFNYSLREIIQKGSSFGDLDIWSGKKILVEHSSPNLFKPFHIGHMMNNTIGESISRLCKISGADTTVISYPSDVSLGIGKAVWQLMEYGIEKLDELKTIGEKMTFLGKCYAEGTKAMKERSELEERIREITQDIYEQRDTDAYSAYKIGRDLNLEYFKSMTEKLGSKFDGYIFESEAGKVGKQIVLDNIGNVYEESNGAIIYNGEREGLHTRVFINRNGNPTYEAKDTGLLKLKFDRYNPDLSIFVTDHEQEQYFKVVASAAGKINKEWKEKTKHMTHGRMKFKGQKMSSRLGNTPIVSDILDTVNDMVFEKSEASLVENNERQMTKERADMISIAALKYTILRTQPGKEINFDPDTSLSFEGDSGPYLQYTYARCKSILRKAKVLKLEPNTNTSDNWHVTNLERYLYRLPGIFEIAFENYAPQQVVGYVTELSQLFNSWYGREKIINLEDTDTEYRLAIVSATSMVIKKALWSLGIEVPEEM